MAEHCHPFLMIGRETPWQNTSPIPAPRRWRWASAWRLCCSPGHSLPLPGGWAQAKRPLPRVWPRAWAAPTRRRFLCVSLEHAIDCTTPVEYEQLYAQLKAELLSGERSWFNKEEEQAIQQHNALFYKHIPEEEVFRLCFRFATQEDHPQEVLTLSATQLFERMKSAHPSVMRGMTAYSLSRILPQLGERVHTAKGNVYRVVAC